jgi:hypothetical protein
MRTHFCIVSEQPIPNLSAALDSRLRADRLVLIASREMQERAERLRRVAGHHGIESDLVVLRDRLDLAKVAEDIERALAAEPANHDVVLNASGGQKPMSIAAYEVFRRRNRRVFYVDTDNSAFWLPPADPGRIELETHLTIDGYLESYGADISARHSDADPHADLTAELLRNVERFGSALSVLNALAAKAVEGRQAVLWEGRGRSDAIPQLLKLFRQHGLLEWNRESGAVRFRDRAAMDYVRGGWLEHHVYGLVAERREQLAIHDLARGVEVRFHQRDGEVRNELDVAFVADNHLFAIECKTRRYTVRPNDEEDELTAALYKLYTLGRNLGGLAGRMMLVSWNVARPYHRERAATLNIRLLAGGDLGRLPDLLAQFRIARQTR